MRDPGQRPGNEEIKELKRQRIEAVKALRGKQKAEGLDVRVNVTLPNRKSGYESVEEEQKARQAAATDQMRIFRSQLPVVLKRLSKIRDPRNPKKITHKLDALMIYGIMMFVFQISSRREANREMTRPQFVENLNSIEQGETPDNCRSEKQYRSKWDRIEFLYHLICEEGYKSQQDLKTGFPFNEIRVQVGRLGDLLFEEGMHRLVICQLLDLKNIPVLVTRRHADWVRSCGNRVYKNDHGTLRKKRIQNSINTYAKQRVACCIL